MTLTELIVSNQVSLNLIEQVILSTNSGILEGSFSVVHIIDKTKDTTTHLYPPGNLKTSIEIQKFIDTFQYKLDALSAEHAIKVSPYVKSDVLVNSGALRLALNCLVRAGKHEVAQELEKTIKQLPEL